MLSLAVWDLCPTKSRKGRGRTHGVSAHWLGAHIRTPHTYYKIAPLNQRPLRAEAQRLSSPVRAMTACAHGQECMCGMRFMTWQCRPSKSIGQVQRASMHAPLCIQHTDRSAHTKNTNWVHSKNKKPGTQKQQYLAHKECQVFPKNVCQVFLAQNPLERGVSSNYREVTPLLAPSS